MVNLKKKSQTLILLILIIIFSINTNFFRNLSEIFLHEFDNRVTNKYNYCKGESIGYLLNIKKNYQIKDNPKIINYVHTPDVKWSIINTKSVNQNSNRLIFLNYPGSSLVKNLNKISNNLFELNDAPFFTDKFTNIKNIQIQNNLKNKKKINLIINIYAIDKLRNKENIKTLEIKDNFDMKSKINLNMNLKNLNLDEKKLYFEIINNDISNLNNLEMKVALTNKYILQNFKIINKTDNCYYVEKI
jgi:hypothetical protein